MALQPELRLTISSVFEDLDLVDRMVEGFLELLSFDPEKRPNVVLAVREAAANAIQHGNKLDSDLPVEVACNFDGQDFRVTVADRGAGFDLEGLPDPLAPENLLKPTGRGILLIRNFMDEVTFEFPEAGGTLVSMRKRIAASKPQRQNAKTEDEG